MKKRLVKAVARTGLFDEAWYSETYKDAATWGQGPLDHFVSVGAASGYRPNAYFDATYYGPRVGISDPIKALLHYAGKGWRKGIDPSNAFPVAAYLASNEDLARAGLEPLAHFLSSGRREGRKIPAAGPRAVASLVPEADLSSSALVEAVRKSPLFDEAYYLAEYADKLTDAERKDPARHYVQRGEKAGLHPNPYFSPSYYEAQLPADMRRPRCLLLHYQAGGWRAGLNPSPRFDTLLYREVFALSDQDGEPLSHYLAQGQFEAHYPLEVELVLKDDEAACRARMAAVARTGLFDAAWYHKVNTDLADSPLSPLEHYVRFGLAEGRRPNAHFDAKWYARTYRDQIGGDIPLLFYAREGFRRLHNPAADFSAEIYFQLNRDLVPGRDDALKHFLHVGAAEGRAWPNPAHLGPGVQAYLALPGEARQALRVEIAATGLFASAWYRREYAGLMHGGLGPMEHYLIFGQDLDLKPNPYFDTGWYERQHKREIDGGHPLLHYARTGAAKGDWPSPTFDPEAYMKANPDVAGYKGSALKHYVRHGMQEGRRVPKPETGTEGMRGTTFVTEGGHTLLSLALQGMIDFPRTELAPAARDVNTAALDIHWVIPDFSAGGGGHMTIFRMISHLERQGHKVTIWIHNPSQHKTPEAARETIRKHFKYVCADVRFVDLAFSAKARGDAIIATDCWTVWPVMAASDFLARFYFVQDFEPYFHPMGGKYMAAELTYKQDLFCICASPWLSERLERKYGRQTSHFWLAADQRLYKPLAQKPVNRIPRIAFYSRISTDRRAVELGLLALELLARRGVQFQVDFFGGDRTIVRGPFVFTDHGVAAPADLAALFGKADVGVVFSATNYSLVPQEMMACGLPIVELDGESTRAIYPENVVTWAAPDPVLIADAIEALLNDAETRARQSAAALEWVSSFSWHKAAVSVEAAILDQVKAAVRSGVAAGSQLTSVPRVAADSAPVASVVIPTYNAGPGLDAVLAAVCSQHTPWPYEVLVIDSGSTDETLEIVARHPKARLHQIEKGTFNHGGTRNLGVELTTGDYIAFLTHDALPANDAWLFNLVMALEAEPEAAGAFGRHLAYPDASAYTKRDLDAHFAGFLQHPLSVSAETDIRRYRAKDDGWRQFLHFYSDNNSCMRRSVWQRIPYRAIAFGEDQVWADDIIAAGYSKLYAAQAVVYHSHDFDEAETQERSRIESSFFKHFFGYALIRSEADLEDTLADLNAGDEAWGKKHGLDDAEIELRKRLNAARLKGYLEGYLADTDDLFESRAAS